MKSKKRIVLAYSGGLDTSIILKWLQENYNAEVICYTADIGQEIDRKKIINNAKKFGVKKIIIKDLKNLFVKDYVFPMIRGNAIYEGVYLLGTSIARPLIAKDQIRVAKKFKAYAVSHGATGKGNDQVRFELSYYSLQPDIQVVAPWKIPEFFKKYPGRTELLAYAQQNGITVKATVQQPWSSDENLMHISFESGMLEDPWQAPLAEMFELSKSPQDAPDQSREILIEFEQGIPVSVDGERLSPAALLARLNQIGGENGIGRVDMVESRFVGMKSRGVYETPGGTILHVAHRAVESLTLDRNVINLKDSLMPRFAQLAYNGFWYCPEMELLLSLGKQSQERVSGTARLELYKGNCMVTGRKSPFSLYDEDIATMEKDQGAYNPQDADGFIRLHALPLRIQRRLQNK